MTGMMMERTGMGMPTQGMTPAGMTGPMTMPSSWMMVPRCTFKFEKMQGGMKITCVCEDATARSMMQNLCMTLQGGMCSVCCMMNGVMVCCCMIQSCCDCCATMKNAGCTCCLMMNNTPVCCGC